MRNGPLLKRYVIHILGINAVNPDAFDLSLEQTALISCTDRSNRFLASGSIENSLIIPFMDVEDSSIPGSFNAAHARVIHRFLQELPECVTDLYVCCSKGGSRSAALAAALLKASGRSDNAVWMNPFYVPNKLVYSVMCRELGIVMPGMFVRWKSFTNERQFKKAKRRGNAGKYERWQIMP
ncbi:MAG: hypothetical protein IKM73_08150 [Acidaminococcaceae bacterium]|nr:hypothetical protein [Acidaminococcaceae bacterium]